MLVRLLRLYFGPEFGYCDYYSGKPWWSPDIKTCCGKIPCKHGDRIWLTKNHDFDLKAPQIAGERYLIQYRDFAPSVVSNFELFVRNGGEDSEISFRRFVSSEFGKYLGFVEKWVLSDFGHDQLILNYSTFLQDPHGEFQRVVTFFAPDVQPDADRIAQAIADVDGHKVEQKTDKQLPKSGVHGDRDLRQFRYWRPALFQQISALHLPRQVVIKAFQTYLGRAPAEENMLRLQGYASEETLEEFLQSSEEYRLKQTRQDTSRTDD